MLLNMKSRSCSNKNHDIISKHNWIKSKSIENLRSNVYERLNPWVHQCPSSLRNVASHDNEYIAKY